MDGLDVLCFEHIPGSPIVLAGCWDQCCGNGYGIVKSIDGGQTWESTGFLDGLYYTDPPARVTSIISHPVYRNILVAAAAIPEVYTIGDAKADIWISNDYGSNWIPCDINGIGSKRINCLEIDPIFPDYIYAGTGGSGLWMANITLSAMDRETTALAQIPSQYSDELNMFPLHYSPISQRQYFKLNIPLRADPLPVAFEIFDLSGRKVDSVLPRIFTPGSHMIEWSSHGVASGTYLCRLNTPENRAMVKFVIIK
jgi:hypothetical protein